jgi:protein-tyrosine phosphatase
MKKLFFLLATAGPVLSFAQLNDSAQRVVHMQGTVNFRDAGGYTTANGKQVVWNKVFRSADISHLTEADLQTMSGKHIHTVVDFRGVKEAAAAPDRQLPGTTYTLCPAGSDSMPSMQEMGELIKQGNFLNKFYGSTNVQYAGARFRPLFQQLLTLPDTAAILYHCTGGRDRTGMASALFLHTLGVPQQKIEEDFVASNVYLQNMNTRMFQGMAQSIGMSVEEIQKAMALRPELIRTFFAALTTQYGSVDLFMEKELGIGPKEKLLLRKKYTN